MEGSDEDCKAFAVMDMEKKDYIQIMIQDLQKKVRILEAIEDADERQKVVLETSGVEPEEFDAIVEEKSKLEK